MKATTPFLQYLVYYSRNQLLIFLFFSLLFSACVDSDFDNNYTERAVVEGYISPGHLAEVTITKEISYSVDSSAQTPINGLAVSIENQGKSYALKSMGNGIYQADQSLVIKIGESYTLHFTYNGRAVSANTAVPEKPTTLRISASTTKALTFGGGGGFPNPSDFKEVQITWTNPSKEYHLVTLENIESNPSLINSNTDASQVRRFLRNQPDQGTSYGIPPFSYVYYGKHRVVLCRINAEYAALYRSTGNNSNNLTTPQTNVVNGLGIFTGVNADTTYLQVTN